MNAASGLATLAGVGYLRPAPGTWGSVVALPLAWLVHELGGFWLFFAATLAVGVIGHLAIAAMTQGADDADRSEIVVDELVGPVDRAMARIVSGQCLRMQSFSLSGLES